MSRQLLTLALMASCASALAWTPYGEAPPTFPDYASGSMPQPAEPMPYGHMPYGPPPLPYGPDFSGEPFPDMLPPGMDRPDRGSVRPYSPGMRAGGIRMTQESSDESYTLIIELGDLQPESVQVRPAGQGLLVRTDRQASRSRSATFGDGRGYSRSYSWSSGGSTRRLPVPPDGDVTAFQREDDGGTVRIVIPRHASTEGSQ